MSASINNTPNLEDLLGSDVGVDIPSVGISSSAGTINKNTSTTTDTADDAPLLDDLLESNVEKKEPHTSVGFSELSVDHYQDSSKDNIFQKALSEKGEEKVSHIIDAIENYSEKIEIGDLHEERVEDPLVLMKKKEEEIFKSNKSKWNKILISAQSLSIFSILFGVFSFFLFSFLLDTPGNGMLGNFVSNNYGISLLTKESNKKNLEKEVKEIKSAIVKTKKSIQDLENNTLLADILKDRIDWVQALSDIELVRRDSQATEESKYIFFENYSTKGKMKDGKIKILITGKVYSYKNVFQKIAKLIDAFNDNDHFQGAEMNRFDKSDDGRQYYVSFSLQLDYFPKGKLAGQITSSKNDKL